MHWSSSLKGWWMWKHLYIKKNFGVGKSLLLVTMTHLQWWSKTIIKLTVIQVIIIRALRAWRGWSWQWYFYFVFFFYQIHINRCNFFSRGDSTWFFFLVWVLLDIRSNCTCIKLTFSLITTNITITIICSVIHKAKIMC